MNHHRYTVLLVDDDATLLRGLERHFSTEPFRLLTAVSAAEASAVLNRYQVDVIVTDNMMPGMTGTEFLTLVRRNYPEIVPIVLSGNITVPLALQAVNDLGVFRMFTKPCDVSELGDAIRVALERKAQAEREGCTAVSSE